MKEETREEEEKIRDEEETREELEKMKRREKKEQFVFSKKMFQDIQTHQMN